MDTLLPALLKQRPELIDRSFEQITVVRGLLLFSQGAVLSLTPTDVRGVGAMVSGNRKLPYAVGLSFEGEIDQPEGLQLRSVCNCPVGLQCKHGAAVALLLSGKAERIAPAAPARLEPASSIRPTRGEIVDANLALPPEWQLWVRALEAELAAPAEPQDPRAAGQLVYLLIDDQQELLVAPLRGKAGRNGRLTGLKSVKLDPRTLNERTAADTAADRALLFGLDLQYPVEDQGRRFYRLPASAHAALLERADADKVYWQQVDDSCLLRAGAARALGLAWQTAPNGYQLLRPQIAGSADARVFGADAELYVDPAAGEIGAVTRSAAQRVLVRKLRQVPALLPESSVAVQNRLALLQRASPEAGLPTPRVLEVVEETRPPQLIVRLHAPFGLRQAQGESVLEQLRAEPLLKYGAIRIRPSDTGQWVRDFDGERLRHYPRQTAAEQVLAQWLKAQQFRLGQGHYYETQAFFWTLSRTLRGRTDMDTWFGKFREAAAAVGIELEADPSFPLELRPEVGEVALEVRDPEAGSEWFETRLGIEFEGQRLDLAPILLAALDQPSAWTAEYLVLRLADGRELLLPRARLAPLIDLLSELEHRRDGTLAVPRIRLHALEVAADIRLRAGPQAQALRTRLARFSGLHEIAPPAGFSATLRPYQQQGLAWLQALRELGFGGVLADDMGLGKTVQVLAHLATEHTAGRLAEPALVVCPTSVIGNWEAEVQRFTPGLKTLIFHGMERSRDSGELRRQHLLITSYALLARDAELLAGIHFSCVIFDEAQWLKNHTSKAFHAAATLKASQRLCLTGTPVENHLGELKAQFDLAFPGLLGSQKDFQKSFRTPIEKDGDRISAQRLKRRIAPFLLRRRKSDVATELPPRTSIQQRVELHGAQRDLYESIRLQMEKRVREALAQRGLDGARITILDALLKLRQICCHPQLLDLPAAQAVTTSAKLEALNELLPTLIEEGRAVLLFSQFTSMLDRIEPELRERGLDFVRLDGSTVDRRAPVQRFQEGAVPIFLISLKAGGVGLNLTRADTVILYDPWWNPAVEQQAIDRAHRIGQDKPVFVYEMGCVDTVEDRMQQLKQRKKAIADAVLDEGEAALGRLTGAELLALFS